MPRHKARATTLRALENRIGFVEDCPHTLVGRLIRTGDRMLVIVLSGASIAPPETYQLTDKQQ